MRVYQNTTPTDKIYLGRDHDGDHIYLSKHEWACDWYWAFGYIGNRNLHKHIQSLIDMPEGRYHTDWTEVSHHFVSTWIKQDDWWVIRDLFICAYALKKAADVYQFGGHQSSKAKPYRVLNSEMQARINADLKTLLDMIWDFVTTKKLEHHAK